VRPDARAVLPDLIRQFDEPFGDCSAIPTFYVSKMARESVTVCLAGDGGDEVFAGYERYAAARRLEFMDRVPPALRRSVFGTISRLIPRFVPGRGFARRLAFDSLDRYSEGMTAFPAAVRPDLLTDDVRAEIGGPEDRFFGPFVDRTDGWDLLARLQYLDTMTYLPEDILVKVDRMSMLNSLEVRVPLLDHRLVEFMARVPSGLKMRGNEHKHLLKRAMRDVLPHRILTRKKMGFGVPLRHWFRGEWMDYARDVLMDRRTRDRRLLDPKFVESLLGLHRRGLRDFSGKIWLLLFFEEWCRCYLDP